MQPATTAKDLVIEVQDREATKAIAEAIRGLRHQPPAEWNFPHVKEFVHDLEKLKSHIPETLLETALSLLNELTYDPSGDALLHGGLHHDNVLKHGDHWVAIDSHGYIGPYIVKTLRIDRNIPFIYL